MSSRISLLSCKLVVVVALAGACAGTTSSRSPAGETAYDGPIFRGVTAYVEKGTPYDFSHGLGAEEAARAEDLALSSAGVGEDTEVGFIAPASLTEGGCSTCAQVTLIDYGAGVTHNVIVDVAASKLVVDTVQDTVVAALGEDGIRGLYGVALDDPEVANVVGDTVAVSAEVSPITTKEGRCSPEERPPHRCAYGVIYFPGGDAYVYVDLTDQILVDWSWDEEEVE